MLPRVILYTEDPPFGPSVVATGLSRANRHIVRALDSNLVAAFSVCTAVRHPTRDSDLDDRYRALHHWLFRFRPRVSHIPLIIRRALNLPLSIPSHERALARAKFSGIADILLAPVGTDIASLQRAIKVGTTLNIDVVAYLVDEPIAAADLSNSPLSIAQKASFKASLLACRGVICITEGLAKEITAKFGIACTPANLPFESPQPNLPPQKRTQGITFIGNTSHFYQDGLVELCEAIVQCRANRNELRLIFTIFTPFVQHLIKMFGENTVEVRPCKSDLDLHQLLASSLAGFVSYSFDPKYSAMTSTSYPSKLTEYLAACKHIIVYAPPNSTATEMMKRHNLSTVLESQSVLELSNVLLNLSRSQTDHSERYLSALATEHSPEQFRNALLVASTS